MKTKLPIVIALLLLSLSLWPTQVVAERPESIQHFSVEVSVSLDGAARFTEIIDYDFSGNERRGVFRDIPTRYEAEGRAYYETNILIEQIFRDNGEVVSSVNHEGAYTRVRMGDINSTPIPRYVEQYELTYRLSPVAYRYEERDVVQLDLLGDQWEVPVERFQAELELPLEPLEAACYAGESGTEQAQCEITTEDNFIEITSEERTAGEGVTVYIEFPEDTFANYMEREEEPIPWARIGAGLVGLVAVLGGFGGLLAANIRYWWRKRQQLVIARYEPPANMTPGEVGLLNDNVSNEVEFTATLIDLAIRGYLQIEYEKRGFFIFKRQIYTLHKRKEYAGDASLLNYERELLAAFFATQDTIPLDKVDKQIMKEAIKNMHKELKERLVEKGYYRKQPKWMRSFTKKTTGLTIVIVIAYLISPWLVLIPVLTVAGIASWRGVGTLASRKTGKGYTGWAHIEGFKEFLALTEAERMDFHEAPERRPEEFSKFLPYAVALGVEKKWAKQFTSIAMPEQEWARGANASAIASAGFVGGLSSGLSSYAGSSGGFSGGGGVGGGAGGGGGGSF